MPLWIPEQLISEISVLLWHIRESETVLLEELTLTPETKKLLSLRKSESHRKGFLASRRLLKALQIEPEDVHYLRSGVPYLKDGRHLSITHAHDYAAIALSKKYCMGIDVERVQDKILRIAPKFLHPSEEHLTLVGSPYAKLTKIWAAKEAVYKALQTPGISFRDIRIHFLENSNEATAHLSQKTFRLTFLPINGYEACVAFLVN